MARRTITNARDDLNEAILQLTRLKPLVAPILAEFNYTLDDFVPGTELTSLVLDGRKGDAMLLKSYFEWKGRARGARMEIESHYRVRRVKS